MLVVTILSYTLPRAENSFALNTIELMSRSSEEKCLEDQ
jgi:hypothetical protein